MTVSRLSIAQLSAPPGMRGRVMANMATVSRGTGTLSQTQSGISAGLLGPAPAVVAAALALGVAAAATIRASPALWAFTHARTVDAITDDDSPATPADEVAGRSGPR